MEGRLFWEKVRVWCEVRGEERDTVATYGMMNRIREQCS